MQLRILFAAALLFLSCGKDTAPAKQTPQESTGYAQFAKWFQVDSIPGFQILTITNPWGSQHRSTRWVLEDSVKSCPDCSLPDSLLWLPRIHIPLKRVVVLSSTYLALMGELGLLDRVVGISQWDLIRSTSVRSQLDYTKVIQTGYGPAIQVESVMQLAPDAVFTFGVGDTRMDDYTQLTAAKVQTMVFSEWMESHQLGSLEWIRLLGVLFKREHLADSLFADRANRYDSLLTLASKEAKRPTILTGAPQGETWFLTGGRNYFAQFIHDAGGHYLWEADTMQGGIQSTMEQVLTTAGEADVWLNPGIWNSRQEAETAEPRVKLFKAYQEHHVYHHRNGDFWELGMARPDLVLADLISILHPELLPQYQPSFYQALQ